MSMEKRLIETVRDYEIIYNKKHKHFARRDSKDKAWKEVSWKVGAPEDLCRTRWKSLRDRYTKIWRLKGADGGTGRKWRYFDALSYLKAYESAADGPSSAQTKVEDSDYVSGHADELGTVASFADESSQGLSLPMPMPEMKKQSVELPQRISNEVVACSGHEARERNSTLVLFESLALKINEAALPLFVRNRLEQTVANYVFDTIATNTEALME